MTMRFAPTEKEVMIKGNPTLTRKMITLEALLKETEMETMTLV